MHKVLQEHTFPSMKAVSNCIDLVGEIVYCTFNVVTRFEKFLPSLRYSLKSLLTIHINIPGFKYYKQAMFRSILSTRCHVLGKSLCLWMAAMPSCTLGKCQVKCVVVFVRFSISKSQIEIINNASAWNTKIFALIEY